MPLPLLTDTSAALSFSEVAYPAGGLGDKLSSWTDDLHATRNAGSDQSSLVNTGMRNFLYGRTDVA